MTRAAHTPAPWVVSNGCERDIIGGPDQFVAVCSLHPADVNSAADEWVHGPITAANRALITAAPETLAGLKNLMRAYVNLIEAGRDRIVSLGGTCDPVDVMERGDPHLLKAREIVAKAEGRS